jgi:hypothetical protein
MPNLGLTVYLWSLDAQNHCLSSCLAPALQELRREGLVSRFWFERMDIRGPHVFAPIRVPDGAEAAVSARLSARIDRYLAERPCPLAMTPAELQFRHDYCRGKLQSAADRLPGLAGNNTFNILPHGERGYPFHLSAGLRDEEELWLLLTELTLWSITQLSGSEEALRATAIRWLAAFDEAVRSSGSAPERYWRHHASTLILNLAELLADGEESALARLSGTIGKDDAEIFSRPWSEREEGWYPVPRIRRIVQIILKASEPAERQRFDLLREILHVGLKQLCLRVAVHPSLVLLAWRRGLAIEATAPALS